MFLVIKTCLKYLPLTSLNTPPMTRAYLLSRWIRGCRLMGRVSPRLCQALPSATHVMDSWYQRTRRLCPELPFLPDPPPAGTQGLVHTGARSPKQRSVPATLLSVHSEHAEFADWEIHIPHSFPSQPRGGVQRSGGEHSHGVTLPSPPPSPELSVVPIK